MSAGTRPYGGVSAEDRVAERRARLLEAGLEVLSGEGWTGMTVRRVCAQAELTERYFYESFANREQLVVAVFERITDQAAAHVLAAVEAAPHDARAKSRAAIEAFVELLSDDPRRGRAMLIESVGAPELRGHRERGIEAFASLIAEQGRAFYGERAVAAEDAEMTAIALTGALAELLVAWLAGRLEVSSRRLVDHCVEIFVAAAPVSSSTPPR